MQVSGRSKYNVNRDKSKRTYDGIVFDSELEMKYYKDVVMPGVASGEIVDYQLQKPYELQPKYRKERGGRMETVRAINYVADFWLKYKDGTTEVIDTKGCPDTVALMKRKMFDYLYPDEHLRWIVYRKRRGGWIDYDTL